MRWLCHGHANQCGCELGICWSKTCNVFVQVAQQRRQQEQQQQQQVQQHTDQKEITASDAVVDVATQEASDNGNGNVNRASQDNGSSQNGSSRGKQTSRKAKQKKASKSK